MRHLLILPFLCAAAAAQADSNRFVPKDSTFVMRMAAPAKWKSQFAKTQLAKLLQAETLSPLMDQAGMAMQGMLEELRTSGAFDADLLEKMWSDYTGEIVIAAQIDGTKIAAAIENGDTPEFSVVVALTPDGKFDLAALSTALDKLIETTGQRPLKDLQVGDHRLRVTADDDVTTSVPAMIDGHLVMLVGSNLEAQAGKLLAADGRADAAGGDHAMSMHAELGTLLGSLLDMVAMQAENEGAPFDVGQMLADIGLGSLSAMSMQIGAEGALVRSDLEISFGKADLGLFGALIVDQKEPKLLRYLPPSADAYSITAFDLGALYRTVGKIWDGLGDQVPMTFADFESMCAQELTVRLAEDLIAHVGTEMLSITDVEAAVAAGAALAEEDEENPMAAFEGQMFGMSLRDGKKFEESLEKALRSRGLHAGRKTEEYVGTKLHRMTIAGIIELEYCVTDDLLLLALGKSESAHKSLRAVLDQRASDTASSLTESVKARLENLPKGWSGLNVTPVASMVAGFQSALEQAGNVAPMPEEMDMVLEVMQGIGKDLRRLGLQNMVATTHTSDRKFVTRMRW